MTYMSVITARHPDSEVAGRSGSRALAVARLTLTDYRNYAELRIECESRPVVLTGPNGAGKSNLLEAISLFAPGRGLRGARFDELARQGGNTWAVAAEVDGLQGNVSLGTAWSRQSSGARDVEIAGLAQRSSGALSEHVRVIWLTPAMDRLFAGPAGDRRRFLDRLAAAFDPDHGTRVTAFDKLLRERNRLLAEAVPDAVWLSGIEHQMAETGVAIAAARIAAIGVLQGLMTATGSARRQASFPASLLAVDGDLEGLVAGQPAVQVEDEYRRMLRDSRPTDGAAGRTLKGPHRSDLMVTHAAKGLDARLCSTGEQKALLIGLVLAHARAARAACGGRGPLVLLDEVAAHLDEKRRSGLFAELVDLGVQAWMSGTEDRLFEPLAGYAQFFRIGGGEAVASDG